MARFGSRACIIPSIAWDCHWFNMFQVAPVSRVSSVMELRSVQSASTARHFSSAVNRFRFVYFLFFDLTFVSVFIDCHLSRIEIAQDLFALVVFIIAHRHQQLSLGSLHHHRLPIHTANHIERPLRTAPQGQLKNIVLDAALHHLAHVIAHLEEPVCRA